MNSFKFEAFKKEFLCLESILIGRGDRPRESRHCDWIKIARLGREFLEFVPEHTSHEGSMVGINKLEEISFVLGDGTVIRNAVRQRGTHGSNYAHSQTSREEGETVLEAINRHQCGESLKLVVVVRSGFVVREHYSEPNYSVALYKAAKGENIPRMIEEAATAALTEVRAEANF